MGLLTKLGVGAAKEVVKSVVEDAVDEKISDAKGVVLDAAKNTLRDVLESAVTGRRPLEDWTEISIKALDEIKEKYINENDWIYRGGRLNFQMSLKYENKVVISYELYFQDTQGMWQKVGAESDMFASNFTLEALEDIKTNGTISYEVG
jgi:hypothetical protein